MKQTRWQKTIFGEPVGAGGDVQVVRHPVTGNRVRVDTGAARRFREAIRRQAGVLAEPLAGELKMTVTFYLRNPRARLDAGLLMEVLRGRVFKSCRQIRELHLYRAVDGGAPRAEICIEQLEGRLARGCA